MAKENLEEFIASIRSKEQEVQPTDIKPFDMVLGGGVLRGNSIELAGEDGAGKSTLLAHAMSNLLAKGEKVMYCDPERGVKGSMLDNMNITKYIKKKQFLHVNPVTYGDLERCFMYAMQNEFQHVCVDSITQIINAGLADLDKATSEDTTVAAESRIQTLLLKKQKAMLKVNPNMTMYYINQMRDNIGALGFGSPKSKTAGSRALKHLCDVRLMLKKGLPLKRPEQTFKGKDDVIFGNMAKLKSDKNRYTRSHIEVPCPILYGTGVSNLYFYKGLLDELKLLKMKAGGHYTLELPTLTEPIKAQGEFKLIQAMKPFKKQIHDFLEKQNAFKLTQGVID